MLNCTVHVLRSRKEKVEEELKRTEDHTKKVEAAKRIGEAISGAVGKSTTVDYKEFTEAIEKVRFGVSYNK